MTENTSTDETITTEAEFEAALTALVATAHENGVSVGKPWLCQTDDSLPDWETMIVELDVDTKVTGSE